MLFGLRHLFPHLASRISPTECRGDVAFMQAAQARRPVLLNRAGVTRDKRMLDIGCGYGRILKAAESRGAGEASPYREQVRRDRAGPQCSCRTTNAGPEWDGRFDAVIANGSLEHFGLPTPWGRDDDIYRHLFDTVYRLSIRTSSGGSS
jgi:cyclopropane fatty-acyl-phospholipid synthase-like methyltransferase